MKPFYSSITNPKYLQYELLPNDALPVIKTNADLIEQVLEYFNSLDKAYFVYFLDGDHWGQRNEWKNNGFVFRYDFQISNEFFQMVQYKDCIFKWADEFVIISPHDIRVDIDEILKKKDFTMTKLEHHSKIITFLTVAKLSRMVRKKKEIQRGIWYSITTEELETYKIEY